jgi:DNA invertase Pin-like site-specific DNA recombinase
MLIGYARVSTQEQNLDLQLDALKQAGCEEFYTDKMSGSNFQREGLEEAIKYARKQDTIVVWRLDRLGRSLKELIKLVMDLKERGVGFRSLQETLIPPAPQVSLYSIYLAH